MNGEVYANAFGHYQSELDVTLQFAKLEPGQDGKPTAALKAVIVLPKSTALALAKALVAALEPKQPKLEAVPAEAAQP